MGYDGRSESKPVVYVNRLLVPDKRIMEAFNEYAKGIFTRQYGFQEQSRALAAQRDALLPGLASRAVGVRIG